jgi:hypothetical protein
MDCVVAKEAKAGATTSERVGAGAPDETCEVAGGRIGP